MKGFVCVEEINKQLRDGERGYVIDYSNQAPTILTNATFASYIGYL
jgi:hypothetical protein